ncbi:hypothetical protein V6N13_088216 [Hibiscus sabdariffa]
MSLELQNEVLSVHMVTQLKERGVETEKVIGALGGILQEMCGLFDGRDYKGNGGKLQSSLWEVKSGFNDLRAKMESTNISHAKY